MPQPIARPWIPIVALSAALAAWMGLGKLHDFQHSDTILMVLISTQKWTPFFWGQDRFGTLVPLLATPVRHPLANMLVQGWIMTTAALVAPFVMARFLVGRDGAWVAIGACTNALFLAATAPVIQFDWLVAEPYPLSIALGFAALIAADGETRWSGVIALALLMLACWVNIGIVVQLAIAAVFAGKRPLRQIALLAVAALAGSLAAAYLASSHTVTALAPVGKWPNGWWRLLANSAQVFLHPAVPAVLAAAAVASLGWFRRSGRLPIRSAVVPLAAMALGTWLVVGTSLWVGMNLYAFRYMYPTLMIAGALVSTSLTSVSKRWSSALASAAVGVIAVAAVVNHGTPSLARLNQSLDERFGLQSAAVVRSGATVIAGDYWRVWPAVFHANLTMARLHLPLRVFGLAFRSDPTDVLWKDSGHNIIVAGWADDRTTASVAAEHGITLTPLDHLPEIDLYIGRR